MTRAKFVAIGLLLSACNPRSPDESANPWTAGGSWPNPPLPDASSTAGEGPTTGEVAPDDTGGATQGLDPGATGTTGACTTTGAPVPGDTLDVGSTGGAGDDSTTGCGGEFYQAEAVPPNVLITLDRSGSMDEWIDGGMTKWQAALDAVTQIADLYGDQVHFGLSLFPGFDQGCTSGMSCGPGGVFVDPAPGTAAQIENFLLGADTCSFGTPIAEHVGSLLDYPGLEDLARANYVLLITDGHATCADPVPPVAALRLQTPEIKTFVVGFGDGVDPSQLNDLAEAGGTAPPGDPKYFQADDAMALADAFASIAGSVLSCTYELDGAPPNDDELYVFFDGVLVTRDPGHADGWDYDPNTNMITFYGPACEQVKSGEVEALKVVFGCPNPG